MKKKILSTLIASILVFSLAGCGEEAVTVSVSNSAETSVSKETKTETSASKEEATSTETSAEVQAPANFDRSVRMYYADNSTELVNTVLAVFPVDPTTAVFQFKYYDATNDEDIPSDAMYSFTFNTEDYKTFTHTEEDQDGLEVKITFTVADDGSGTVAMDYNPFQYDITGKYSGTEGTADAEGMTFVEYLRCIPEAGIDDFGLYNPYDEVFDTLDWMHDVSLVREGDLFARFLIADDFSAIYKVEGDKYTLIYGSPEGMVSYSETLEFYNEDEDTYDEYVYRLVHAALGSSSDLTVGDYAQVYIEAPIDLTESIKISTDNADVLSVDTEGTYLTAKAPGEATVKVDYVFGGISCTDEIKVTVTEYDADDEDELKDVSYVDEKYATYFDKVSQRAVLEICREDGLISVDVLWGDDATTMHHWSYIGTEESNGTITLSGSYYIENMEEEFCDINLLAEDITGTLTLGNDGCYYWHDDNEDAGAECIFELPPQ